MLGSFWFSGCAWWAGCGGCGGNGGCKRYICLLNKCCICSVNSEKVNTTVSIYFQTF